MARCLSFVFLVGVCAWSSALFCKPISPVGQVLAQGPTLAECPLFGGTPARNMVNLTDKNTPTDWSVEEGKEKNILWKAMLGTRTYGGPVIAGGRIFVGTNNETPRDPKKKGNMSVLMCFDEKTGKFLWQIARDAPKGAIFAEVVEHKYGLLSTPVIDGDRVYYVLPECVVVCADVKDGKIQWEYDMTKQLKVLPYHCGNCSPLVAGNHLFIVTGNGIADSGKMHNAKAPSFIALDKTTGKLAWQSNLPGDQVFEGQWSNPAYGVIQGKPQVIFPGGDGALYSFEPDTGKLIWQFRCYPKYVGEAGKRELENYIVATPAIHDNKVYVGMGVMPDHTAPRFSYVMCIDATRTGDVSPTSLDPKAVQGKNSALLWSFGGPVVPAPKGQRNVNFRTTISTCAIHDGLVYIPEEAGYMHCLDAKTGQRQWVHDFKSPVWGSPYYVDGKVYVCTEDGEVVIFQAGRALKIINKVDMDEGSLHSTPVVVGGVLYVATKTKLYAIKAK